MSSGACFAQSTEIDSKRRDEGAIQVVHQRQ